MAFRFSTQPGQIAKQAQLHQIRTASPVSQPVERQYALCKNHPNGRKWNIIVRTATFRDDATGIHYSMWEPHPEYQLMKWKDAIAAFIQLRNGE